MRCDMRLEFINRVKEKDILGKSILTNDGSILLRAGIALTEQYISKLKKLGHPASLFHFSSTVSIYTLQWSFRPPS